MMKFLYSLLGLMISITLNGQVEVPISENTRIKKFLAEKEANLPEAIQFKSPPLDMLQKSSCELENDNFTYVNAGDTVKLAIRVDTTGLDTIPGMLTCLNCSGNSIGTAEIQDDSLFFVANTDVQGDSYSFEIEFCNLHGCSTTSISIVARRSGMNHFPATIFLEAEEVTSFTVDAGLLPGPLACNNFVSCESDYQGSSQKAYFLDYSRPNNKVRYHSSRYAGLDSLCVELCDTFAICDTFRYSLRISKDTIGLPFMDDFSYNGPFPSIDKWLDKNTFVNNDMAENPPSIGVATFDGLDENGAPYGGDPGRADHLTSTYINLSGIINEVVLTYYVQRRGLVDRPETPDSLILEFKDPNGNWKQINQHDGAPISQPNTAEELFTFSAVTVPALYRHKGFQFRFVNFADRKGIKDNWHIDYIRLDNTNIDSTISDVAFTHQPNFILSDYSSMPWRHLQGNEVEALIDSINVGLFNHDIETINASPSSVRITEVNTGIEVLDPIPTLFNGQEANIPNQESINRIYLFMNDPTGFPDVKEDFVNNMTNPLFDGLDRPEFVMEYKLNAPQVDDQGLESVKQNDLVLRRTVFDEYFAYDDGTAETGLVTSEGTMLVVKFTTAVPDTLRAVRFHFPRTTVDVSDQLFEIVVWVGSLSGSPKYEREFLAHYTDLSFDTLQGFSTYSLIDDDDDYAPLALPAGDFYVGWKQVTNCDFTNCIPVGYDKNHPQAKRFIYRNFGQGWQPIPESTPGGALMLRPVVGSETPGFTDVDETAQPFLENIRLYPNPAYDRVQLDIPDANYDQYFISIFNNVGQLITSLPGRSEIALDHLQNGVYFVRITNQQKQLSVTKKLMIVK